ncbi:MAG: serine/threonine protein kinase, partial [Planctomycetales bacterium]|nr:serine/threonine protein kinase [Planctomycetales bacterium]
MPRQEFRQDSRSEPLRSDPHEQRLSDDELQVFRQRCQAYSGEELDDLNDGLLPKTVGRFEICEQIGSGSFGTVYLAFDRKLTRNVAVKVAHIGAHSSARLRARFLREAHAAARLAHQNVVSLHEYGDEGGLLYLVYEMCDGPTLEHWMAEQPDRTAPRVAVAIVRELASGLAHAHSRGLVHRDVKPGNVLLQPKGEPGGELPFTPRITDFGLAHDFLARDQKSLTAGLFGTIDYMSPEQAQGDPESIRPSSDLYALGVLLYRLLTGVLPFAGSNIVETLQRICVEPPVAPRRINPAIAKDLEAICLKCLSKKPEGRYTSCAALAQDLGRYLQGAVVQARPQSRFERGCRLLAAHPLVSTLTASIIVICLISVGIFSKMDRDLRAQHAELQQTLSELMASQAIAGKAQMSTFEALAVLELQ